MKKYLLFVMALLAVNVSCMAEPKGVDIIPYPQSVEKKSGTFSLTKDTVIIVPRETRSAVALQEHITQLFNVTPKISTGRSAPGKSIVFKIDESLGKEAYQLSINSSGITVSAATDAGWFYAVQSLKQLLAGKPSASASLPYRIPALEINDHPRFAWRAFMLDEARYFKGKDEVKMLLDEMARLKMNTFHWHLVDDQGWRIEIKKYPLLTEVGSVRKSTQVGDQMQWDSPKQSGEVHKGFYTQADIREIVGYASDRHITIVPEIEMPGHASAAIAAYPWLGTKKEAIEVPTVFGVSKNVYDVSDPKVIGFLHDVLDEVMALFPSQVIHIGGDEVKYDHWKDSASVQRYMKEKGLSSPVELQVYFTNTISQYLSSKGRRMMGWNEILGHNLHEYQDEKDTHSDQTLAKTSVVHFWKGDLDLATKAAQDGFDIVNSIHTETYLDYLYKDIPLSRSYAFDPVPAGLAEQYHQNIIGSGTQMWSEWIPTRGEMHYMVFPRIAAYAEVGWTLPAQKDFARFKVSLENLKDLWRKKGIHFSEAYEPTAE